MEDQQSTNLFTNLPSSLLGKSGTVSLSELINFELIGLYFSAHWCPPCRGFTPKLADHYKEWKKLGVSIEVVFVSSDRSEEEFNGYFSEMPWLAVPKNSEAIGLLKKQYEISGIPTLIILDKSGKIIDAQADDTLNDLGGKALEKWLS